MYDEWIRSVEKRSEQRDKEINEILNQKNDLELIKILKRIKEI